LQACDGALWVDIMAFSPSSSSFLFTLGIRPLPYAKDRA